MVLYIISQDKNDEDEMIFFKLTALHSKIYSLLDCFWDAETVCFNLKEVVYLQKWEKYIWLVPDPEIPNW